MNHGGLPVVNLLCQPGMGAGCSRCANPVAPGRWWADALGWVVLNDSATGVRDPSVDGPAVRADLCAGPGSQAVHDLASP